MTSLLLLATATVMSITLIGFNTKSSKKLFFYKEF